MKLTHSTIRQLKQSLDSRVHRIAIFGSATYKDLNDASDIDILLFVNPTEFNSVREYVCSLDLNTTTHVEEFLCSYSKLPDTKKYQSDRTGKMIHFAFLSSIEAEYTHTLLWRKNLHNIRYL